MKRRLNRAYDHMTMPDSCVQRIEQQMQQTLEEQKTGRYTKTIQPASSPKKGWTAAVAAVCLILVLSVGGSILFLYTSNTMMDRPTEATVSTTAVETSENTVEDAVLQQNRQKANALFAEVLNEKQGFTCEVSQSPVTITQYCEKRSESAGTTVRVPYFTMVDMDRDGIKELILWVFIEGDILEDYLILRYQEYPEGGMVYTYMEPQKKITALKKDGSFYWRGGGAGRGETRMVLGDNGIRYIEDISQTERVPVLWHAWPCVRPEEVLQSYEYTGTGQSVFPGTPWYVFEGIAKGTMSNDWNMIQEQFTRWGMVYLEEDGEVSVYDPDAPGCRMFGTLDEEGRFLSIGYYISNEYGEREAEIRDILSDTPQYVTGSHLDDLDAHGREVVRLKELLDYLS